jgi:4-amino-4-deoxy-L-arabinose transferase-like glycosyltransferase
MNYIRSVFIHLIVLLVVWIVTALAVNPMGDFPLNDDWAYGYSVRTLVEKGDIQFSDWTATNLIAQVVWGAVFCLPFGFSFTALRISTLVLGIIGVIATYGLLREARAQAWLALFGALVLAFNPIYLPLSFTFMSDVPFIAIAAASSWLLLRGLRRNSRVEIAGGLILAGIAILIRQVGLTLPIAFAIAYLFRNGISIRRLLEATLPVAGGLVLQIGFEAWLRWSNRLPATYGRQINSIQAQLEGAWGTLLADAAMITLYSLFYAGLFLFSFLVVTQRSIAVRFSPVFVGLIGISTTTTIIFSMYWKLMPLHVNIFNAGGLGCCDGDPSQAPKYVWVLVTFISALGATLLLLELIRSAVSLAPLRTRPGERYVVGFALAAAIIAFAPLPFIQGFYDRYLIVFLPWLMLAVTAPNSITENRTSAFAIIVGALTFLSISIYSIAATHDYLSANRVRWTALNRLLSEYRVKPERIDGGFEFNGLYLYERPYTHPPGAAPRAVGDDYVVSYFIRANYTILERLNVRRWLPWGRGDILIQSKNK